jgi:tryptophan synthase alpha chain
LSRISEAFERARSERRAAFVPYLTAGDPSPAATVAYARELDRAGADVLELGVPFSDPIADGPVLQRSAARALAAGTSLESVWEIAADIRAKTSLALVLFSYLNPIVHRGLARVAREARSAGFDAFLATDLPADEAAEVHRVFRAESLDTVFLVSPTSPAPRMRRAAEVTSGFLYVVSRAGTTGARNSLPADLADTVARARRAARSLPIAVGFGISSPETARAAAAIADGVVVGSALVSRIERDGNRERLRRFAASLARACRRSAAARGAR